MKYFTLLLLAAIAFSSCNIIDVRRIKGNGKITTKNYDIKNFKSVDAGGAIHIYLKQDSVISVKVETDENLIENLKVEKVNGELEIRTRSGVNLDPTDEIKVILTMPVLKSVRVSGASSINSEGKFTQNEDLAIEANGASEAEMDVRAPRLNLDASGASTLTISGETRDYSAEATGASTLKAFDLRAENAVVRASGASTANVFSSISLSANASGASGIHYKGNPKLSSNASGASSVDKAD